GEKFHNAIPGEPTLTEIVRWRRTRTPGGWPQAAPLPPGPRPRERVGPGELRVTFINHATVLIQIDGLNVLTDPIWGDIAGPTFYIGRERKRPPGLRFGDLPPIDVVLISHDHYDHLDVATLQSLQAAHHPRIIA